MIKWFLATNLFIFGCAILQTCGAMWYFRTGSIKFGILYCLYASTNYVIWICKGE